MIKVIIGRGGLGNQMFCYSFYILLKNKVPFSFVETLTFRISIGLWASKNFDYIETIEFTKKSKMILVKSLNI